MSAEFTEDGFLGGRLKIAQPRDGFRAGHDAVLLAAAVPAKAGERVLELGSGSGVAALCLAARVAGVRVHGIEIEPELVKLANENAARNHMADRVSFAEGDAANLDLRDELFAHVFFNPPFHPDTGQISPVKDRDRAKRGEAVSRWTRAALAATRDGGTITAILRADREREMVDLVKGRGATVLPLLPRTGEAEKRIIVRLIKGRDEPVRRAPSLVLHAADGRPTNEAEAILRNAGSLAFA